jgi:hypothetical protein
MKKNIQGKGEFPLDPSSIEHIDTAMFNWLEQDMDLYATTNRGWKKTPVIWMGGERAHQIKHNKDLRDRHGSYILPIITVQRTTISKDLKKKGKYWANVPGVRDEKGGSINIVQEVNQEKTANFQNADIKRRFGQSTFKTRQGKTVFITKSIPLPIYISVTYEIEIKTEFQQQMNELIQPFMSFPGGVNYFIIENEGHRYEAFLQTNYSVDNNISNLNDQPRMFTTKMTVEVLGHIVGKGANQDQPKVVYRENIVEVKIPREYTIVGDIENKKKLF